MKLDNIINMWDTLDKKKRIKYPGTTFILFSFYIFPQYVTLDIFNWRFNFSRKEK